MHMRSGIALFLAVTIAVAGLICSETTHAGVEDMKTNITSYFAAWNEPDEVKRIKLLEQAWGENAVYTDPGAYVEGRAALAKHIGEFQANPQFKGFQIVITSGADIHHDKGRFTWKMINAEGATVMEGIDFAEFDKDGRLSQIVGFFGPMPKL